MTRGGETPKDLAAAQGYDDIVQLLEAAAIPGSHIATVDDAPRPGYASVRHQEPAPPLSPRANTVGDSDTTMPRTDSNTRRSEHDETGGSPRRLTMAEMRNQRQLPDDLLASHGRVAYEPGCLVGSGNAWETFQRDSKILAPQCWSKHGSKARDLATAKTFNSVDNAWCVAAVGCPALLQMIGTARHTRV